MNVTRFQPVCTDCPWMDAKFHMGSTGIAHALRHTRDTKHKVQVVIIVEERP